MNITLSIDERLVAKARGKAKAMGKTLNQVIREYLETLTGADDTERWIEEFERLSRLSKGSSHGRKITRDELHERS